MTLPEYVMWMDAVLASFVVTWVNGVKEKGYPETMELAEWDEQFITFMANEEDD